MTESVSRSDLVIIALYFLLTLLIGVWYARRRQSSSDWLVASRRLTLPFFVATLVSTWYGGILGVGEFTYKWGIVNWLALGGFYYAFALIYALFLARRVRQGDELTIPARIAGSYGQPAGRFAAIYTFLLVTPAPYMLMLAKLLSMVSGLSFALSLFLTLLITIIYVWIGGFRSVIITDMFQFLLMFAGFLLLVSVLCARFGGWSYLVEHLPAELLSIPGPLRWNEILIWGFMALWTLVDPGFYQRVSAASSPQVARRGILLSIGFWFLFDFLTTASGLYARALLPDIDPVMAYPQLALQVLPAGLLGLFFAALMATIMSTMDSFTFLSGLTIARDFLGLRDHTSMRKASRRGLLITTGFSVLLIIYTESVIQMWITIGSLGIPVLLLPLLSTYMDGWHPGRHRIGSSMVLAGAVSIGWFLYGLAHQSGGWPVYPWQLEPIYPGLLVSVLVLLVPTRQAHRANGHS